MRPIIGRTGYPLGVAELEPHDTTSGLIARADDELLENTDARDQTRSAPNPTTATAEG